MWEKKAAVGYRLAMGLGMQRELAESLSWVLGVNRRASSKMERAAFGSPFLLITTSRPS